jgi:hypothetical protein
MFLLSGKSMETAFSSFFTLCIYPHRVYYTLMNAKLYLFAAFCFVMPLSAQARPVSYAGGWMFMTMNDTGRYSAEVNYSPSAFYSIGGMHEYMRDEKYNVDTLTLNVLAKRWNLPGSQANFYIKSGVGTAYESDRTEPAAFTGFEIDWEDRRFFTLYENRFFYAGDIEKFAKHTARLGIAPYIGDAGDLHTWIMLQADYQPGDNDDFSLTPMVRLFKDDHLFEAGINLDGGGMLNYTKQF